MPHLLRLLCGTFQRYHNIAQHNGRVGLFCRLSRLILRERQNIRRPVLPPVGAVKLVDLFIVAKRNGYFRVFVKTFVIKRFFNGMTACQLHRIRNRGRTTDHTEINGDPVRSFQIMRHFFPSTVRCVNRCPVCVFGVSRSYCSYALMIFCTR